MGQIDDYSILVPSSRIIRCAFEVAEGSKRSESHAEFVFIFYENFFLNFKLCEYSRVTVFFFKLV